MLKIVIGNVSLSIFFKEIWSLSLVNFYKRVLGCKIRVFFLDKYFIEVIEFFYRIDNR